MRKLLIRHWLIAVLVVCLLPAAVQAEGNSTLKFQLHGTDPVITHYTWPACDGRYTDPGAVVVHDGKFHMFRNIQGSDQAITSVVVPTTESC